MIHKLAESKLLSGYIYGDNHTGEYIYLPGSEIDSHPPVAVYEHDDTREDVSLSLLRCRLLKREAFAWYPIPYLVHEPYNIPQ